MKNQISINENLCKGCSICIDFCPRKVFEATDNVGPRGYFVPVASKKNECNGCLLCEHLCPELALTVIVEKKPKKVNRKA